MDKEEENKLRLLYDSMFQLKIGEFLMVSATDIGSQYIIIKVDNSENILIKNG